MNKVKRLLLLAFVVSFIAFQASAASGDTTVYVTDTGEKYHSYGCQYLRKSSNPITLSRAVNYGYTRCSKCSPPYFDEGSTETEYQSKYLQENTIDDILDRAIISQQESYIKSLESKNKTLQKNLDSAEATVAQLQEDLEAQASQHENKLSEQENKTVWCAILAAFGGIFFDRCILPRKK